MTNDKTATNKRQPKAGDDSLWENMPGCVRELVSQAAYADDPTEAMKWSQAALNAANALCSLNVYLKEGNATA